MLTLRKSSEAADTRELLNTPCKSFSVNLPSPVLVVVGEAIEGFVVAAVNVLFLLLDALVKVGSALGFRPKRADTRNKHRAFDKRLKRRMWK